MRWQPILFVALLAGVAAVLVARGVAPRVQAQDPFGVQAQDPLGDDTEAAPTNRDAAPADATADARPTRIRVMADGGLAIDGRAVALDPLTGRLPPRGRVLIEAHPEVNTETIQKLLRELGQRGLQATVIVTTGEEKPDAPPTALRSKAAEAERISRQLAQQYRDLRRDAETAADAEGFEKRLRSLRDELRLIVGQAFALRQQLQTAEAEALGRRLDSIRDRLRAREELREKIVQRRVDELIEDERLRWDAPALQDEPKFPGNLHPSNQPKFPGNVPPSNQPGPTAAAAPGAVPLASALRRATPRGASTTAQPLPGSPAEPSLSGLAALSSEVDALFQLQRNYLEAQVEREAAQAQARVQSRLGSASADVTARLRKAEVSLEALRAAFAARLHIVQREVEAAEEAYRLSKDEYEKNSAKKLLSEVVRRQSWLEQMKSLLELYRQAKERMGLAYEPDDATQPDAEASN